MSEQTRADLREAALACRLRFNDALADRLDALAVTIDPFDANNPRVGDRFVWGWFRRDGIVYEVIDADHEDGFRYRRTGSRSAPSTTTRSFYTTWARPVPDTGPTP